MIRLYRKLPPSIKILLVNLVSLALLPFSFLNKIFNIRTRISHSIGYFRVLKKGDVAIQAGVDWDHPPSSIVPTGNRVGETGTVIAIEPNISMINRSREEFKKRGIPCKLVLVNKACHHEKGEMEFFMAEENYWNRLDYSIDEDALDEKAIKSLGTSKIKVQTDTIDNIIAENSINPMDIRFVSLTINGSEYPALKGLDNLLTVAKDLSLTVVAGRNHSGLDTYEGRSDVDVISELLQSYGFKTKFRFTNKTSEKTMGYVMAKKGNAKYFF